MPMSPSDPLLLICAAPQSFIQNGRRREAGREETSLLASGLVRLGALAAMLAGVVFLVDEILGLMNPAPYLDVMFVVAMLFVLAGMGGVPALLQRDYGRLGGGGFYPIV